MSSLNSRTRSLFSRAMATARSAIPSTLASATLATPIPLIADFTGDGHRDLAISVITGGNDFSSADVYLQAGNGDGTFQSIQKLTVDTNLVAGVTDDFDGNGLPDAAFIGSGGSNGGRPGCGSS